MGNKGKVSFDFDNTLSRSDVQDYAYELIAKGYDVHILTSREPEDPYGIHFIDNSDLENIARRVGIPKENILYTSYCPKYWSLEDSGMLFHLDDCEVELGEIDRLIDVPAINVNNYDWREHCDDVLGI